MAKKILHVLAQMPEQTGSGIYLRALIYEAWKAGHDQAVIIGVEQGFKFPDWFEECQVKVYPVYFSSEELPFHIVGMSDVMPYISTKYEELVGEKLTMWKKAFQNVLLAAEQFKPEITISHHIWLLSSMVRTYLPRTKLIIVCHGSDLRQQEKLPHLATEVCQTCATAEHFLALNEYQQFLIMERCQVDEHQVAIIPGGYNEDIFCLPKNAIRSKDLLFAGKLSLAKGLMQLLKVAKKISGVELTIAGSGSSEESKYILRKVAENPEKFTYLGMLSQKELASEMQKHKVFVLPSYYEGLPLVIIEALACGCRVVCSDLPGLRSFLGEDLLKSGVVELVNLPRLKHSDQPLLEDLPTFEEELLLAIKRQLSRCEDKVDIAFIRNFTWQENFRQIASIFD
ncbi:MAG: glycosyltransferase family 4 protein [Clostridia bacterium]